MRKRLLGLVILSMVGAGCSQPAQSPSGVPQTQHSAVHSPGVDRGNTELLLSEPCKPGSTRLSVAGVELGKPVQQLLSLLGDPKAVERSPRFNSVAYQYDFGTIAAQEPSGQVFSVELWSDSKLGDLWPEVRFGATRNMVLQALSTLGLCPQNPDAEDLAFANNDTLLVLAFSDGILKRVRLAPVGEP